MGQNANVLLSDMADASEAVAGTSSRLAKIEVLAKALHDAGPAGVTIAVAYLSGELPQRQIGVGWATLKDAAPPADHPSLTLTDVDAAFTAIGSVSGTGSVATRKQLVDALLGRATAREQAFLFRLLAGELRQGALEGVMAEAIARAAQVPGADVRRALMLSGSMATVAQTALAEGSAGLAGLGLQVGRPIGPMLASSAPAIEDALARISPAAVEWKMDGIRIQAHIRDGNARLFTRTLDEITERLPEVTEALAGLPVRDTVLDGEVIAVREDGRPHPFQITASRTARRTGEAAAGLSAFVFDIVHLDGEDLIDRPGRERFAALARVVPERLRMPRLVTSSVQEATGFFDDSIAHGHEGVVVKSLDTPYTAGRRGAGWIKVKPRHTLDLVILAAEWGHGRRRGKLSNLHLGARDPDTGGFSMLGKTFKGKKPKKKHPGGDPRRAAARAAGDGVPAEDAVPGNGRAAGPGAGLPEGFSNQDMAETLAALQKGGLPGSLGGLPGLGAPDSNVPAAFRAQGGNKRRKKK